MLPCRRGIVETVLANVIPWRSAYRRIRCGRVDPQPNVNEVVEPLRDQVVIATKWLAHRRQHGSVSSRPERIRRIPEASPKHLFYQHRVDSDVPACRGRRGDRRGVDP